MTMTPRDPDCVFCRVIDGTEPAQILQEWPDTIAIRPVNPITSGRTVDDHTLIIPRKHVADATVDPVITTLAAHRAAQTARTGQHITVNIGAAAGQTVFHLHWHVFSCLGPDHCMPWGCPT